MVFQNFSTFWGLMVTLCKLRMLSSLVKQDGPMIQRGDEAGGPDFGVELWAGGAPFRLFFRLPLFHS